MCVCIENGVGNDLRQYLHCVRSLSSVKNWLSDCACMMRCFINAILFEHFRWQTQHCNHTWQKRRSKFITFPFYLQQLIWYLVSHSWRLTTFSNRVLNHFIHIFQSWVGAHRLQVVQTIHTKWWRYVTRF